MINCQYVSDGWRFKVTIPGNAPDGRPMTEWYAAWIADQTSALAAVQALRGGMLDPMPEVDKELSESELRALSLQNGQAKRIHAEF